MPLGQQIGELAVHLDVARLIQPEGGEGQHDQQDGGSVTPEKSNIALDDAVGATFLRCLSRHDALLRRGKEWYRFRPLCRGWRPGRVSLSLTASQRSSPYA